VTPASYFSLAPSPPASAIRFRNTGLQNAALPEAIVPYTVSGLDDRDILPRTAVPPALLLASVRDAPAGSGHDIYTVQELLVHKDVTTTVIYTHVLRQVRHWGESPLD